MTVLVTGGTGGLGRPTVERLAEAGHEIRVLSRSAGDGRVVGDLKTGEGLADALAGADTVLHLATSRWRDLGQTRNLLTVARAARVRHLVFISIVGIDGVNYGIYRDKVACEAAIEASGIPWTILRATQFHTFPVELLLRPQERWPRLVVPDGLLQPIAVEEVAARLVELAAGAPAGRVPDIGGPEVLPVRELAARWDRAHGRERRIHGIRPPGSLLRAWRHGTLTTGLPGYGRETFAEFAARAASR